MKAIVLLLVVLLSTQLVNSQTEWTRDPRNPVLIGEADSWKVKVFMPTVIYNPDKEMYEMWYGATPGVNYLIQLAYANSVDGIHWNEHSSPVLTVLDGSIRGFCVLYDAGEYKMWFPRTIGEYQADRVSHWGIFLATSGDGINWTVSEQPLFVSLDGPPGYTGVSVIKNNKNEYEMWLNKSVMRSDNGKDFNLLHAVSTNGLDWTMDKATDFKVGQSWEWDYLACCGGNSMVYYRDRYYFYYTSQFGVDGRNIAIGMAVSDDGIHWTKYSRPSLQREFNISDPVLTSCYTNLCSVVESPSVLVEGNSLRMWYACLRGTNSWFIGHATAEFGTDPDPWEGGPEVEIASPKTAMVTGVNGYDQTGVEFNFYPNPIKRKVAFEYSLENGTEVELTIFDAMGRQLEIVVNGYRASGIYREEFDASALKSGIYFCRLKTQGLTYSLKMIKN